MNATRTTLLITLTGRDRPGVTSRLFAALTGHELSVLDIEQVVIRGRLVLGVLCASAGPPGPDRHPPAGQRPGRRPGPGRGDHHRLAGRAAAARAAARHAARQPAVARSAINAIAGRIAASGANIDRITRLAQDPVTCIELDVSGADPATLRSALAREAAQQQVDVAVQRGGLQRRAMRLIVMDVDSTLIQRRGHRPAGRPGRLRGRGGQGHRGDDARGTGLRGVAAGTGGAAGRAERGRAERRAARSCGSPPAPAR